MEAIKRIYDYFMNKYFFIIKDFFAASVPYLFSYIFFLLPLKKNKFFCMSMAGKNYGDNIKCLSDYIKNYHPNAEVVWAFDRIFYEKVSCEYTKVKLYSFKYYYHISTAKYFLTNQQCRNIMYRKRHGQVKLQTWHGTALKRLGKDIVTSDISKWVKLFTPNKNKYELRDTDIFIAGSRFMSDVFQNAYGWKNIYITGTPRNDIFFHDNESIIVKVCNHFNIIQKKIILYAPTFRSGADLTYYDIDLNWIKNYFENRDNCEYVILVRLHPNIMFKMNEFSKEHTVDFINATLYPDVQELLYAADVLITDYSSVLFDFMYSYKPIILYVPDRLEYNRGFYLDIDSLPFIIVNSNKELPTALASFDWSTYHRAYDVFFKRMGSAEDGRATVRVYDLLVNHFHE